MRDEEFIRGNVPMTKSEVRAVSISKLELWRAADQDRAKQPVVLYDVGSGTGSVAVEAALQLGGRGRIYAIERDAGAMELTEKNRAKFRMENIETIFGTAPEALEPLPAPTHVFIGGSGGRMEDILRTVLAKNPGARVVINAAALETLSALAAVLEGMGIEPEIVSVQTARGVKRGRYHMLEGQNPVFVLSFGGTACD